MRCAAITAGRSICGSRLQSDAKLDHYAAALYRYGFHRWAVEESLGYTGVMPSLEGQGGLSGAPGPRCATEAARELRCTAPSRVWACRRVLTYTAPDDLRSRAVMERLGLQGDPSGDAPASRRGTDWSGWPDQVEVRGRQASGAK